MDEMAEQVRQIAEAWKRVHEKLAPIPAQWQPHWPNGQLILLDEMTRSLEWWMARVRAPTGFGPGFQLAKMLVATILPSLQASVNQLEAGQYNYLPTFVGQVQDALSKIHSMVVYSDRTHADQAVADQSARLAEALAVMGTAQRELAAKVDELRGADAALKELLTAQGQAETSSKLIEGIRDFATTADTEIKSAVAAAKEQAEAAKQHAQGSKDAETSLEEIGTAFAARTTQLDELLTRTEGQSRVIDQILPKAASAGLAEAFSSRGRELNWTRNFWAGLFGVALVLLAAVAFYVFTNPPSEGDDFWQRLAVRLTLFAPLVWLGWVSAVQYGNIIRVQEDYAFKQATSKAFQGYRDHFQHLQAIDAEGSKTASQLLAEKTILILAQDPLRIYGTTDQDASPAHSLIGATLDRLRRKPTENKTS